MLNIPTTRRRTVNVLLLVLACALSVLALRIVEIALLEANQWSGWTLCGATIVLLFYAARKRLSTLPLGRVALWLQAHIYLGLFCLFLFGQHLKWQIPQGWLEVALAISFTGTVATGLLGLYWSRTLPSKLTRVEDEVLYERINEFSNRLCNSAERTVLKATEETGSHALADFYRKTAYPLLARPNFQLERLFGVQPGISKVERELDSARLFMAQRELDYADEVFLLVKQKDGLDTHYTLQAALKYWLFVHFAFSLSMIPLLALHIILVYSFG